MSAIKFEGLRKTKAELLLGTIQSKIGDSLSIEQVQEDVNLIKSLNLFFEVQGSIQKESEILFTVKEANYLYPVLGVSGFKNQFKLETGVNQINFLGKAHSIGAQYLFYDRHSFSFFYTAPRHIGRKTGHEFSLSKYSTREPLYFMDTMAFFNFDNYSVSAGLFYSVNPYITFSLGGMYMYEQYAEIGNADLGLAESNFQFNKYQIRTSVSWKKLKYEFERLSGFNSKLYGETIQTDGYPEASFIKTTLDINYFRMIGRKGNFAIHQRLGIATNNFSPFSPFVLDGFLNVRGIGNRIDRGTAEIITNIEYRQTVWRNKYFNTQIISFTDFGTLRSPGQSFTQMLTKANKYLFAGLGLRLHSRVAYNTIFRLDYSVDLLNLNPSGFIFGFGHFF